MPYRSKNEFSHTVQCCPPPEYPVLSDWSADPRLTQQQQSGFINCYVTNSPLGITRGSPRIKSGSADDAFRTSVFCGRKEPLDVLTSAIYTDGK